jgi:hypothetical protein
MVKKTLKKMYDFKGVTGSDSDSDSDSETESKKMIMKLIKKHSKKHGSGLFDDIGNFAKDTIVPYVTDKKGLASDVLQYGLPSAMGAIGAIGGPAGAVAGKEGGVLLSKQIAQDNGMSRRSQDPFESGFLQQSDASQPAPKKYTFPTEKKMKGKMIPFMDKATFYKEFHPNVDYSGNSLSKEYIQYMDDYDKYLDKYIAGEGIFQDPSKMGIHIDIGSHNAKGTKAKTGMGFFDDFADDLRPVNHTRPVKPAVYKPKYEMKVGDDLRTVTKPFVPKYEMKVVDDLQPFKKPPVYEQTVGEGLRSRKKAKDHVSRRAFDEYIKNEMDRMGRKDLAEARAVRAGKKAKPSGGYGYGLKGSPEMAEKMAKLRAMRKK